MADWAGLLPDLLVEIAKRIPLVEDFMAFRGVCTSWRAAAADKHKIFNSWPAVPLLMLAETENGDDREFYSLCRGKVSMRFSLPEAKGKKCMEAGFGWLLTVDIRGELELLHPFSRERIELPPQYSLPDHDDYETSTPFRYIEIGVLSASPSHTSEFVLMVIHSGDSFLGFWRPGDKTWTRIESRFGAFSDVNYYNGKFYAIGFGGDVWVWDALATDLTVAKQLFRIDDNLTSWGRAYLVESAGELLVVLRDGIYMYSRSYGATHFGVIQLDLIKGQWEVINNLGDRSIFVGHNAAYSVDVRRFPGSIRRNCIYFSDDCIDAYAVCIDYDGNELVYIGEDGDVEHGTEFRGGGKDIGVYNLEDGKIERFDNVESYSLIGPPVWVAPCF